MWTTNSTHFYITFILYIKLKESKVKGGKQLYAGMYLHIKGTNDYVA